MKTLLTIFLSALPALVAAQMADSMKSDDPWRMYVFVSSSMPTRTVISLAREAAQTKSTMVLKGFPSSSSTMSSARVYVEQINSACCGNSGPGWIVHPKLFEAFEIHAVPAFVLSRSETQQVGASSIVSGDMGIANALKFFAQDSSSNQVRKEASRIYQKAFKGY